MTKKRKFKLKKSGILIIAAFIALIAVLTIIVVMRMEQNRNFVYDEHLQETAFSIDGENVTIQEISYYIWNVEKKFNEMAVAYNPDNPKEFWNTHFKAALDSTFTRDYAKRIAKEVSVYNCVMRKEADRYGVTLTTSEIQAVKEEASDCYAAMTSYAKEQTKIKEENLISIFEDEAVIRKFLEKAAEDITAQGFTGDLNQQLSYSGEYYNEYILTQYNVQYNDALWEKITMGTITLQ